jgi:mono/diheme cytochrome c family protein
MQRLSIWRSFGIAVGLMLVGSVMPTAASAQALGKLEARGRAVLMRFCSDCHAVGPSGRSPHTLAPPMRDIGQRYDIDKLIEELGEGFTAPHPDMPTFRLTPEDARAVRAYLKSIQQ